MWRDRRELVRIPFVRLCKRKPEEVNLAGLGDVWFTFGGFLVRVSPRLVGARLKA